MIGALASTFSEPSLAWRLTYSCPVLGESGATYTVVSCHFGDPFWIKHTLDQLDRFSDGRVQSVILVDQSRASREELQHLPRVQEVLSFPVDTAQVDLLGHDHPASLNRALQSIDFTTTHVVILDSDCFPIDDSWLDRVHDVTLASDPRYVALSHPCFMVFPASIAKQLDFAEGIQELQMDTGRLIGVQISRLHHNVHFTHPTLAFQGYRGHFLLDASVYHHGSASFSSSRDSRLSLQVDRANEQRFKLLVAEDTFTLPRKDLLQLKAQGLRRRASRLIARHARA